MTEVLTPGPTETNHPSEEHEQTESISYGEEPRLRLRVENHHFYTSSQVNSDQLRQVEEKMQGRNLGEEKSSEKMINNDHSMDQTVVDKPSELESQVKNNLYEDGISTQKISSNYITDQTRVDQPNQEEKQERMFAKMQRGSVSTPTGEMMNQGKAYQLIPDKSQRQSSSHENLLDGNQGEIIVKNLKSSACSICKSKRPNIAWQKDFTYDELLDATEEFSINNSLSESKDGPTFKGLLESKLRIVVKKYQIARFQEDKIFKSEVKLLSKARHKNVVMLLGLCTNKSQLMIVYEQACNGSLDQFLSRGSFQSLTWIDRKKVAIGTARGLKYLHGNDIIHGSIKSSNILLTHDFEPMIGDFGFPKAKLEKMKTEKNKEARNLGYAAPELLESGKPSSKADVYSFGVVLLELITGRRATDKLSGGKTLVGWARALLGGKKYLQLVDPKISNSYEEEQLKWLVQVTEQCLRKNPKERLTMNMVVSALQGLTDEDECTLVEYSSSDKSCIAHDEPAMASPPGQMADGEIEMQEHIERKLCGEDRGTRLEIKTSQNEADQMRQDGKQVQSKSNLQDVVDMVSMMKIEIVEKRIINQRNTDQKMGEKQMQGSSNEDLLNRNESKIILENSESSVYEHACNGSLHQYLPEASGKSLTWRERMKVAIGVARGLKYLHDNHIVHGRLKPSNILLTHEFKPLLGDFMVGKEKCELKCCCKDKNRGKCGYSAPEYHQEGGNLSNETDVYSFGVILLELITGCMITEVSGQKGLIEWAMPLLIGRKYLQLVDPKIGSSYDEQELDSLVQVTEKCLRKNPKERFTMNMIVDALSWVSDSNDSYATEDSSSEKQCIMSDVTGSKGEDDSPAEEEENIICSSGSNSKTEITEENDSSYTTCTQSIVETYEMESLSTKAPQNHGWCLSYGGARDFFQKGAKEYAVCQEFFILCNLFKH